MGMARIGPAVGRMAARGRRCVEEEGAGEATEAGVAGVRDMADDCAAASAGNMEKTAAIKACKTRMEIYRMARVLPPCDRAHLRGRNGAAHAGPYFTPYSALTSPSSICWLSGRA